MLIVSTLLFLAVSLGTALAAFPGDGCRNGSRTLRRP